MGWLQAPAFKQRLREYQARTGKTQAKVAEDLGTTYGTLRFWLSGTRPPKRENMTRAAELFGCSITEFWDDPASDVPGLDPGDLHGLSAAKRAVMNMMFQRLRREDVTDEEALEYYKDLMYLVERGKVRKPRWE